MRREIIRPIVVLLFSSLTACRGPLPCEGCDETGSEEAGAEEASIPDLPCGGADLQTDDSNCGSCGNECPRWYPDTEIGAGGCQDGVCGPGWRECSPQGAGDTCAQLCEPNFGTCVPDGCAGVTAVVYDVSPFLVCNPYNNQPRTTIQGPGSCDQAIPWQDTIETSTQVLCCCDFN